jgi:inositol transport system substrate-binding protein
MKNIKKLIAFSLAAVMTFCLAGCNNSNSEDKKDDTKRTAYIARTDSDYFGGVLTNAVKKSAQENEFPLDVFESGGSSEKQIEDIEKAIADKYDCIIVQPQDGETLRPQVEKIVNSKIIAITVNPRIDGISSASSVDADAYDQGKSNCDLAYDLVPQNAKVVVFKGPATNSHSNERRKAWQENFFDKRSDVTIIEEEFADWDKEKAKSLMQEWTAAGETIDAVISMNDDMCVGALDAVEGNSKYDNMLAFGVDGTLEALMLIKEGRMTATCMQNAYEFAELIIDTADKLLSEEEKVINDNIGNKLITSEYADIYIDMFRELGA